MINLFFEEIEPFEVNGDFYKEWLSVVCVDEQKKLNEVNLIFCSDEYLLNINIEFLQHDYYTDIISFDYCEGKLISGDLFISKDRVIENAGNNNVAFLVELNRVVVHGVLHLCGYKDKTDGDVLVMRSKEDYYLSKIVSRETI